VIIFLPNGRWCVHPAILNGTTQILLNNSSNMACFPGSTTKAPKGPYIRH
jgi:hypothetical protein